MLKIRLTRLIIIFTFFMVTSLPLFAEKEENNNKILNTFLIEGKAALEDGLNDLAEKKFKRYLELSGSISGDSEEVFILLLRSFYEGGKYKEILDLLKTKKILIRNASDQGAFHFWSVLARYKLKNYDKALAGTIDFEKKYPESKYIAEINRLRAWCYLDMGETNKALNAFSIFDEKYGNSKIASENLLEWSKTLINSGRIKEAEKLLTRLVDMPVLNKTVYEGHYYLGKVFIRDKKWEEAENILKLLSNNENADDNIRVLSFFSMAVIYEALTNFNEAVVVLEKGINHTFDPKLKEDGMFNLGRILISMGRIKDGISSLKTFISSFPSSSLAGKSQLLIAETLLDNNKDQKAVEEFQYYLETFTNNTGQAKAHYGKGWSLMGLGRYAEASTEFLKAYNLFTDRLEKEKSLFKIGDSYFANGQYKLASATYRQFLSEFSDSGFTCKVFFQLGESMARAEMDDDAEKIFLKLVEKFPKSSEAEKSLLRIAEIKRSQGRLLNALEYFNRLINVYSNGTLYAEAINGRGLTQYNMFNFREALTDFEYVADNFSNSPSFEQAFYMRGMCYYWSGKDEQALSICREFVSRYPESIWASRVMFWIGEYEYNAGNYEEAEKEFILFSKKYPSDYMADDALLHAGISASKQKEYIRSIEILTKIPEKYPNSRKLAEARFEQAEALFQLGKCSSAILVLEKIINKYPNSDLIPFAWLRKGDCQFALGKETPKRYNEGIKSYSVVANSSKVSLELVMQAEYWIGRCYEKQGKIANALDQYYAKVMIRFLNDLRAGVWHNESSKIWFTKASMNAVDILIKKEDWREAVNVLERVVDAGVPASNVAEEKIKKIRLEHWLLFY